MARITARDFPSVSYQCPGTAAAKGIPKVPFILSSVIEIAPNASRKIFTFMDPPHISSLEIRIQLSMFSMNTQESASYLISRCQPAVVTSTNSQF